MLRERFNDSWVFAKDDGSPLMNSMHGAASVGQQVTLPHDAMIYEKKTQNAVSKTQTGFYPGGKYLYLKSFDVPEEWMNQTVFLEFEGIYGVSKVFINGQFAASCRNGYRNFHVCMDTFLKYGCSNEIRVEVNNTMEPNSRWYSGSGFYRNVNILRSDLVHLEMDGVKIDTEHADEDAALIRISADVTNESHVTADTELITQIYDADQVCVAEDRTMLTVFAHEKEKVYQRITLKNPKLWNCDSPNLYTCKIALIQDKKVFDKDEITFGIRTLDLDAVHGLRINGKETKLRGTCIHHDNGIIGACTLEAAEERRCRLLKEAGFNCIRSSHNPVSKAMLNACDRLGMLILDELTDVWNCSKNTNDYSMFFIDEWEQDVQDMVNRDYNHPSVIIYCMGNEIAELGTTKGASLNRKINQKFKELDPGRYTTNGINGLLAASRLMSAIMKDIAAKRAKAAAKNTKKGSISKEGGSNALNSLMGMLVGETADQMAVHPLMTRTIEEAVGGMDIAGFNYMTARHVFENELNANRVVLGTETFPSELARLWKIVKSHPFVLGDMTWTGYDYLGESGIGIFYYDGKKNFGCNWPDSVAYCGDLNLIGYRRPVSYLREIVYGLRKTPYIAVERVNRAGQQASRTPWMTKDNISSWTWTGLEGTETTVDIYSDAPEVELFLNEKSLGRKACGEENGCTATYQVVYEPGELKALAWDGQKIAGEYVLKTASAPSKFRISVENEVLYANGSDLAFVTVAVTDENGNENLLEGKKVHVTLEGPAVLQGFGSADPRTENYYQNTEWETYDGYLLACIRAGKTAGEVILTFEAEGMEKTSVRIEIREQA